MLLVVRVDVDDAPLFLCIVVLVVFCQTAKSFWA